MRKISVVLIIVLLLNVLAMPFEGVAADNNIKISIDGKIVEFNSSTGFPFADANGRTQVPFRITLESFGAKVDWNQATSTAIAEKDGIKIEVPLGKKYIVKNGQKIMTDTVALVKNSRTYLPIRPVIEALGGIVDWDNSTKTVIIKTKEQESAISKPGGLYITEDGKSIFINDEVEYGYNIIKEIVNPKYKGRKSGTPEYMSVANYIANEFEKMGLKKYNNSYLQKYKVGVAEYAAMPTMSIDGNNLVLLEDFKPMGSSKSGELNGNEIVYIGHGYEEDYTKDTDVNGKIVLFDSNVKEPTKIVGILDRVIIAAKKGAKGFIMIADEEFSPLGDYEHTVNYNSTDYICTYISREAAKKYFKIDGSTPIPTTINSKINLSIKTIKKDNQESANVIGIVEGVDKTKTLIVSTNLDGLGTMGDIIFESAGMNASGVGSLMALAKFYSRPENKPAMNIAFVLFGSKFQNREGSEYFFKNNTLPNVIADLNMFDVGGEMINTYGLVLSNGYKDLFNIAFEVFDSKLIEHDGIGMNSMDNYNMNNHNIPNIFLRCSVSEYNSKSDTLNTIKKSTLNNTFVKVNELIYRITIKEGSKVTFDKSKVKKVKLDKIGKEMYLYTTNLLNIYYTNEFMNNVKEFVEMSNEVVNAAAWWNYNVKFPVVNVYVTKNVKDAIKLTDRLDFVDETTGGISNYETNSISIHFPDSTVEDALATFAHELNHIYASSFIMQMYKQKEPTELQIDEQEITGHVFPFFISSEEKGKSIYRNFLEDDINSLDKIDWSEYQSMKRLSKSNDHRYTKLASVERFIWTEYGRELSRDFQAARYKNPQLPISESFKAINLNTETILKNEWVEYVKNYIMKTDNAPNNNHNNNIPDIFWGRYTPEGNTITTKEMEIGFNHDFKVELLNKNGIKIYDSNMNLINVDFTVEVATKINSILITSSNFPNGDAIIVLEAGTISLNGKPYNEEIRFNTKFDVKK